MGAFINGIGAISPQHTFEGTDFLNPLQPDSDNRLTCVEPDYANWIEPKLLRRMSRILKMGVASAQLALKQVGIEKPDAIITGTAYGCLDDTGTFLTKMISNKEQALNPTPFIQSTHNTIGSQIALLLQCLGYNQTYSQRAFSFENALLDGLMSIDEHQNILVGGVDEMTDLSFEILNRFPIFKRETIQGEGSVYFVFSKEKTNSTYAEVKGVATIYKPKDIEQLKLKINKFLTQHSLSSEGIDFILTGKNGDHQTDQTYQTIISQLFANKSIGAYKHLCGEYPTANAFALWLAAKILKEQAVPDSVWQSKTSDKRINRILIYNQYLGDHHSFILVEA